jgi:prevent-host-death family protein
LAKKSSEAIKTINPGSLSIAIFPDNGADPQQLMPAEETVVHLPDLTPIIFVTAVSDVSAMELKMRTMTSLEAQNHFGELIDTSQREPVLITRRGRPVSIVISPCGDAKNALFQFMKTMSELSPLRGDDAETALAATLSGIGQTALAEGLTESDVARMIDDTN